MLYNLIEDGFGSLEGYNCSEKIVHGANQAYNLNLPKDALLMSGGFGGGMGIGSSCGALTGAVMIIGSLMIEEQAKDSKVREAVVDFLQAYEEKMGSIYCRDLKEKYFDDENKCNKVVLEAAKTLDQVFEKLSSQSYI